MSLGVPHPILSLLCLRCYSMAQEGDEYAFHRSKG
jgi:hypothetical protein